MELVQLAQGIDNTFCNLTPPDVASLAAMGTYGENPQNCQRDLLRKDFMQPDTLVTPKPFVIKAWVLNRSSGTPQVQQEDISIFLPHEWIKAFHTHGYADHLLGSKTDIKEFWEGVVPNDPKLYKNPMIKVKKWNETFCPMVVHADKGPHTKHDSIHTISMYSLLAAGEKLGIEISSMLLCAIPVQCLVSKKICQDLGLKWIPGSMEATMDTIGNHLAWSFNALFEGYVEPRDAAGRPYPDSGPIGAKCIVWAAPADCEHLSLEYNFENYNSNNPCMRCNCNRSDIPWNDWTPGAKFRETIYTPEQAMKKQQAMVDPPWLLSIKGTSSYIFAYDLMHCGDIGFVGRAIANCLFDFLYKEPAFLGTKAQKMQQIFEKIKHKYNELGILDGQIQRLRLQDFIPDKGAPYKHSPDLMHSAIKAKQTNRLLFAVGAIVDELKYESDDIYRKHRWHCMKSLRKTFTVCDNGLLFLSSKEAETYVTEAERFLRHYDALSKLSVANGSKQWHQTPKFHFMVHIGEDSQFLNPRAIWCYPGEHIIGNATSLAQSCLAGLAAHKVPATLCQKYQFGKHLSISAYFG